MDRIEILERLDAIEEADKRIAAITLELKLYKDLILAIAEGNCSRVKECCWAAIQAENITKSWFYIVSQEPITCLSVTEKQCQMEHTPGT